MRENGPVVAIVDDDPRLLESLEDLLESAGYTARRFSSAEALLAGGLADLDLLITDIGMPGMDGCTLRDLAMETRPDLPVFLITGRHEIEHQLRARGVFLASCGTGVPCMACQRASPVTVSVRRSQSHRPSAAADTVSESSSSRSRTRSSPRLRSEMSCAENSQHGSPSNSTARMDCSTVRCTPVRVLSVTS